MIQRRRAAAALSGCATVAAFIACGGDDDATPTRDAGTPDSTPIVTLPADTGAAIRDASATKKLLYSEDFESYGGAVANGAKLGVWSASLAGVTMSVDGTQAFSGTKALHVTTTLPDGGPSHGTLHQSGPDGGLVPGNDLHGRAMVYYSNATGFGLPLGVHSWLFSTSGPSWEDGGKSVNTNLGGGGSKLQLNHHFIDGGERSAQGGTVTAGAWHCIQWELDGSGSPARDANKVWLDGTLVIDAVPPMFTWPAAVPWQNFDVGFTHYQGLALGDFVDMWLDDFALDDAPIACPTK